MTSEAPPSKDENTTKPQPEAEEDEEEDLEKLQEEIRRMEEEAARIAKQTEELQNANKPTTAGPIASASGGADGAKRENNSIYVGQVDYLTTPEELLAHFEPCGTVERVTICCDKLTGRPKGFAYLEFQTEAAVTNALKLDGSTFKERQLKITYKRVNDPNHYGGRGRGRGRAPYRGGGRGRGGGRSRGRGGYHPYY